MSFFDSFFNRRPFSHVEATRVTNTYAALHALHSQMVLDTCPIRAACQKDPTLKAFDDLAASWTIGASSLYLQAVSDVTLRCWFFTPGYIDLVMNRLIPLVEQHTDELREAWDELCSAGDVAAGYERLNEHLWREAGPTSELVAMSAYVWARFLAGA